jgi:hypothetical protein
MISPKKPNQKKLKKAFYSKKSLIFKTKKTIHLTEFTNRSFTPSYTIPSKIPPRPKKRDPAKKKATFRLNLPSTFIPFSRKNERKPPAQKKKWSFQTRLRKLFPPKNRLLKKGHKIRKKGHVFKSSRPITFKRNILGRQKKFLHLIPNVIYRKRFIRRRWPRKNPRFVFRKLYLYEKIKILPKQKKETFGRKKSVKNLLASLFHKPRRLAQRTS